MQTLSNIPRPLLLVLAILYAAAMVVYSGSWAHYIREQTVARLGIDFERDEAKRQTLVTGVASDTPAQRAGFRVGDDILAVNQRPLATMNPFYDAVSRGQPGDVVTFAVRRPGAPAPIDLRAILAPVPLRPTSPPAQRLAMELLFSYQLPFVVVGLAVLFLRLDNRDAWLLALMFGGFTAGSPLLIVEPLIHPALRGFAFAYMVAARGMFPAVFYYFFATFPVSSPIDRRAPWLKSLVLTAAAVIVIPLSLWTLVDSGSRPLILAEELSPHWTAAIMALYFFGVTGLGLVSLIVNRLSAPRTEARRKIRVILWGMLLGVGPFLAMSGISVYSHTEYWNFPFWIWVPTALTLCLVPIAFAYAVVKHRVLEIPVLLKRSVRYVLVQRGFIVLLFVIAAVTIAVFTRIFSQFLPAGSNLGMGLSAVFGIFLVWTSAPLVKHVTGQIDRAFFRSAYDARQILEDLASKSRTVTSRSELAGLLEQRLQQALQPVFQVLYLENNRGRLEVEHGKVAPGLETLSGDMPLLATLAERGDPFELPPPKSGDGEPFSMFLGMGAECLVPILGRQTGLAGLLVLGGRLSEEPYSGEDRRLLASAASQAGVALENIGLAEKMAERMEAERRSQQEMEIARQVQSKLLPQKMPPLRTLDYAGECIQARAVGGDYYDFLDLGPGRVGFVLADIAGKGISAALLMANLQANLRSQYAVALENLRQLLESVNRLFYESTEPSKYATLFFATYDDSTRCLRYVNCGHNPPVLLHREGKIQRLAGTATVLGLFESWQCSVAQVQLEAGDLLVMFTDGITEAMDANNAEFGEARLLETLQVNQALQPRELLSTLLHAVQKFSGAEQSDDLTLVVARGR